VQGDPVVEKQHVAGFLSKPVDEFVASGHRFEEIHRLHLGGGKVWQVRIGVGPVDEDAKKTAREPPFAERENRLFAPGFLVPEINGVALVGERTLEFGEKIGTFLADFLVERL